MYESIVGVDEAIVIELCLLGRRRQGRTSGRSKIKVNNMGFGDRHVFDIGSRDYLHKLNKLDEESIIKNAKELLKQ